VKPATFAIPAERERAPGRAVARAGSIGLAAGAIGLLAQLLFFDTGLGINFPVAIVTLLACAWFVPARPARWPKLADAWLPLAAVVLAGFVALRGDRTLIALDVLGSITLTTLALASFGSMRVVHRPFVNIVLLGLRAIAAGTAGGSDVIQGLLRGLPLRRANAGPSAWPGVLRGLMLALPLLLLFVVLFSSADAVFARILSDLFALDLDLGSLPGRLVTALAAAWLTAGLLVFVSRGSEDDREFALGPQPTRRMGSTEAITVLIVLDLLFGFFVVLQATYLFGGRSTLDASGLTYAEYARRGFFELLAVAFAVGGLVLGLEAVVRSRSRTYLATLLVLVALTLVVLASAFLRLRLYQDAYGWTELRFYVFAAIVWMAVGAIGATVCIWLDRTRWLPHGMVILSVAFGLAFNVIGPVRFIAEQNIARVADGTLPANAYDGVDLGYLAFLGDDALAVIAEGYPDGLPRSVRAEAQYLLEGHASRLAHDSSTGDWQAWNLSRERIRALLSDEGLLR
jgi:hypothetical protein